jgi:hypothetical protein
MIPIGIYIFTIIIALIVILIIGCASSAGQTAQAEEYEAIIKGIVDAKNIEIANLKKEIEKIQEMRWL